MMPSCRHSFGAIAYRSVSRMLCVKEILPENREAVYWTLVQYWRENGVQFIPRSAVSQRSSSLVSNQEEGAKLDNIPGNAYVFRIRWRTSSRRQRNKILSLVSAEVA
jgi:hypothetical protein